MWYGPAPAQGLFGSGRRCARVPLRSRPPEKRRDSGWPRLWRPPPWFARATSWPGSCVCIRPESPRPVAIRLPACRTRGDRLPPTHQDRAQSLGLLIGRVLVQRDLRPANCNFLADQTTGSAVGCNRNDTSQSISKTSSSPASVQQQDLGLRILTESDPDARSIDRDRFGWSERVGPR